MDKKHGAGGFEMRFQFQITNPEDWDPEPTALPS